MQKASDVIEKRNKCIKEQLDKKGDNWESYLKGDYQYVDNSIKVKNEEQILAPKHINFGDKSKTFIPKEKDRMMMSKSFGYASSHYGNNANNANNPGYGDFGGNYAINYAMNYGINNGGNYGGNNFEENNWNNGGASNWNFYG